MNQRAAKAITTSQHLCTQVGSIWKSRKSTTKAMIVIFAIVLTLFNITGACWMYAYQNELPE